MASVSDPSSLSNPLQATVRHWHLDVGVDFTTKKLSGTVTAEIAVVGNEATNLVLDTRDLSILSVTDKQSGAALQFELSEKHPAFGSALTISLPATCRNKDDNAQLRAQLAITYETSPSSSAIQWLDPAQTAGKQQPYLFTQCQAIHARSLLPCQDTPSVKSTYSAKVTVPGELTALMSAERTGEETVAGKKTCSFQQKLPIPSYLVAIVVGALESRKIGPRSHVWSEKEMVDKAAFEFSETEAMLQAAESIGGEYLWGVYDLLVLPPSFPYGGMENPCLTFVTPTTLAGDKSLTDVIAHEISHSWTGNLITNINWEHFWLNEGITVYLERRIIAKLYGEKERHLRAMGGLKTLSDAVGRFGSSHPFTAMVPNLKDVDPDDAFSTIPYEKGFLLLFYLETLVGSAKEMESFLRSYVDKFKYKNISTLEWKNYFLQYFQKKDQEGLFGSVDWESWFSGPGMPKWKPQYDTSLADECTALADRWATSTDADQFSPSDIQTMSSNQVQYFLDSLLAKPPLGINVLEKMETTYQFCSQKNSEIRFRWLRLCLKGEKQDVFPHVVAFVTEQGRMKFVRPLYRELYKCPGGKDLAVETFKAHRDTYHPIASTMIAKDLNI